MKGYLRVFLILCCLIASSFGDTSERFFQSRTKTVYYLEPEPKYNWNEAAVECQRKNMTLLSVESRAKNVEITNLLYRIYHGSSTPSFYIGGNDLAEYRKFVWFSNGRKFKYTNWYRNEPNNHDDLDERCVSLGYYGNEQWNDINCNVLSGFICEKKLTVNGVLFPDKYSNFSKH